MDINFKRQSTATVAVACPWHSTRGLVSRKWALPQVLKYMNALQLLSNVTRPRSSSKTQQNGEAEKWRRQIFEHFMAKATLVISGLVNWDRWTIRKMASRHPIILMKPLAYATWRSSLNFVGTRSHLHQSGLPARIHICKDSAYSFGSENSIHPLTISTTNGIHNTNR